MGQTCCCLVVACVLVLSSPCHAQQRGLRFDRLSVDDGLSNAWVQSILKDSRGFLWFGTQDGLNRYDGAEMRIYRSGPDPGSLPSSVAMVLFEDSHKRLWVGSGWGNAGLARYDREHDRFDRFRPRAQEGLGNNVRAIIEDAQGQLWLGTDNGIARLDPATGAIGRFPLVPDEQSGTNEGIVSALHEDRQGRLWVGGYSGLFLFDRHQGRYQRWSAGGDAAGLSHTEVWAFYEEPGGALWVATLGSGLYRLDTTTGRYGRFLPNPSDPRAIANARVRRLVPDGRGHLYVGTENGGLDVLDLATREFSHNVPDMDDKASLRSDSIWSLHLDNQGILLIGTFDGGVNYLCPAGQRFQPLSARRGGLSDSHVSAVFEDRSGNLWIGTGGGLNKVDSRTGRFSYFRHDPKDPATLGSNAVWTVLEDSQRRLWVGGWDSGLGLLDPVSGRVQRFRHSANDASSIASDSIWRIVELRSGELLVITHEGADLLDPNTRRFTHLRDRYPGVYSSVLYSAAEDGDGSLWLAGPTYLGKLDRRTGHISQYRTDPNQDTALGKGWTQAVLIDSLGNVWFGTEGGLACLAADGKRTRRYTTADGLLNDKIASIQEDGGGNLWLGTNRGLAKLVDAIHLPDQARFVSFDVHDGLAGSDFVRNASCRCRSGRLYFGGSQGLSSFDPEQVERNSGVPPVVLTDLKIFHRPAVVGAPGSPLTKTITETSTLELSYRHSMVTFDFAALNFVIPEKNRYAYKLEGFDTLWNEVGAQRSATYTNLPPGTFTLRVRASNNDGVWNKEGVSLRIHVTPPFWKTRWFLALVTIALMGGAAFAYRRRVRHHIRVEEALQERVAVALADIKTLRGLLPICAWCKKVRDDGGYWNQIEEYVRKHTEAEFSHGICPDCLAKRFERGADGRSEP